MESRSLNSGVRRGRAGSGGADAGGAGPALRAAGAEDKRGEPAAPVLVEIEGVTKRFGPLTAVDGVSLAVRRGEFFALLGASGSGKTTLLRLLAGFETPSEGRILLDGVDISHWPPYERPLNMMFQSYALFPHMTVAENVAFGLKQERAAKAEIAVRVADALRLVELSGLERRKPHQLSGGQAQRVALARALVKRPKVLLLDEPLAALDKKLRERTRLELKRIQEHVGITFLIVTHDQEEAMTLADRIAVMDGGRILQVAPPADLYERPNSRRVAEFVGDVNIFGGRLVERGGGLAGVDVGEDGGLLRVADAGDAAAGAEVWIGVRPEKIAVARRLPTRGAANWLAGRLAGVSYFGNHTLFHVRLGSGRTVTASAANSKRPDGRSLVEGGRVYLTWPPQAGVLLTR